MNIVKIYLSKDIDVRPVLSKGESFSDIINRQKPYAAINGTYYDKDLRPLGDIIIDGKIANRGHYRNAVAFTRDGRVEFLRSNKGRLNWNGYAAGIAAGPRLAYKGKIALDPVSDGFSKRSLTLKAWRSGIGKTRTGNLLLVTVQEPVTLAEFAKLMLDLGAVEAMNLDGGGACALYHDGKFLSYPILPMTNILVFCKRGAK